MDKTPIIVENKYSATPEEIWKAITDPDAMKKWYFDLPGFKAEVGYKFNFIGGPSPERQYNHLCEVTEVIPMKKLTYSWNYDGYAGNSFVTFEMSPELDGTSLKLTHDKLETFPSDNPDFAPQNFEGGWNSLLGESLKGFLGRK